MATPLPSAARRSRDAGASARAALLGRCRSIWSWLLPAAELADQFRQRDQFRRTALDKGLHRAALNGHHRAVDQPRVRARRMTRCEGFRR